jgi:hypothetical protein
MPCLSYKNRTKTTETVTCKGAVNTWADLKKETEITLSNSELTIVHNTQTFNNTIYNSDEMMQKTA